jgi:DnaJ-class molecular chaperone
MRWQFGEKTEVTFLNVQLARKCTHCDGEGYKFVMVKRQQVHQECENCKGKGGFITEEGLVLLDFCKVNLYTERSGEIVRQDERMYQG